MFILKVLRLVKNETNAIYTWIALLDIIPKTEQCIYRYAGIYS